VFERGKGESVRERSEQEEREGAERTNRGKRERKRGSETTRLRSFDVYIHMYVHSRGMEGGRER